MNENITREINDLLRNKQNSNEFEIRFGEFSQLEEFNPHSGS